MRLCRKVFLSRNHHANFVDYSKGINMMGDFGLYSRFKRVIVKVSFKERTFAGFIVHKLSKKRTYNV